MILLVFFIRLYAIGAQTFKSYKSPRFEVSEHNLATPQPPVAVPTTQASCAQVTSSLTTTPRAANGLVPQPRSATTVVEIPCPAIVTAGTRALFEGLFK